MHEVLSLLTPAVLHVLSHGDTEWRIFSESHERQKFFQVCAGVSQGP